MSITPLNNQPSISSNSQEIEKTKLTPQETQALKWCKLILEHGDTYAKRDVQSSYTHPQEALKDLQKIRALRISGAGLKEVPEEISLLANLRILDIGTNFLTTLPEEIKLLCHLRSLILSGNPIETLPDFILKKEMKSLDCVVLNETRIKTLPYSIMDIISEPSTIDKWVRD